MPRLLPLVLLLAAACSSAPPGPTPTATPRLASVAIGADDASALAARARLLAAGAFVARPGRRGVDALADSLSGTDRYAVVGPEVVAAALLDGATPRVEQLVPIARLPSAPLVLAVATSSPLADVNALRTKLLADASSLRFAGPSVGGVEHEVAALAVKAAENGASALVYAAYGSVADAVKGVETGQSDVLVSRYADVRGEIDAKRLRALAIASGSRVAGLDVPTLREAKLDVDLADWALLVGPPTLTQPQLASLRDGVQRARTGWADAIARQGWIDDVTTSGMTTFVGTELARATALYAELGLRR